MAKKTEAEAAEARQRKLEVSTNLKAEGNAGLALRLAGKEDGEQRRSQVNGEEGMGNSGTLRYVENSGALRHVGKGE